jgi:hypothetical protein
MRSSGAVKAVLAWVVRRSTDQMPRRVEVGCVGRQVVCGDPVLCVDEGPHTAVLVDVQVAPYEGYGSVGLLVGGNEEIVVLGPGEALAAAALMVGMAFGPVDQAGVFAGLITAQGGHGEATLGSTPDPDDRRRSASAPRV